MDRPRLPPTELEALLAARPKDVADAIRRTVADLRPCVHVESARASGTPIRGRFIHRILGRPAPKSVLSVLTSKFGGAPYCEKTGELEGGQFLGQINFSEVTAALNSQRAELPDGMPTAGLFAMDRTSKGFRVRWYPNPRAELAVDAGQRQAIAKYEAAMTVQGSWSLRGLDWFAAVPKDDQELWTCMNELDVRGVDRDSRYGHKLFGHPNEILSQHESFVHQAGGSTSIRDYALIWRVSFDNQAGFDWGTHWIYALIEKQYLERGELNRAVVAIENA